VRAKMMNRHEWKVALHAFNYGLVTKIQAVTRKPGECICAAHEIQFNKSNPSCPRHGCVSDEKL